MMRIKQFIDSLCFWRYRARYYELLGRYESAVTGARLAEQRASRLSAQLDRLQWILSPYGKAVLTGQALDTIGPIHLPPLEFEMAKAFLCTNSRRVAMSEDEGWAGYAWAGRRIIERKGL